VGEAGGCDLAEGVRLLVFASCPVTRASHSALLLDVSNSNLRVTALTTSLAAQRYIISSSFGFGSVSIGSFVMHCFISWNAFSASAVHWKSLFFIQFFKVLKKGSERPCPPVAGLGEALSDSLSCYSLPWLDHEDYKSFFLLGVFPFLAAFECSPLLLPCFSTLIRRLIKSGLVMPCMNPDTLMHSGAPLMYMLSALKRVMNASMGSPSFCLMWFLSSFRLWFGSSAELACLSSFACLCRNATLGPSRKCTSFFLSPGHVKKFMSLAPSLVNTVVLAGPLCWVELDSSCLSLEKMLGLRPRQVLLDMVYGLGLHLFLVLLFLSHGSDLEC
nr:hypothetical protein [Tanacetum cinerariifolium]